MQIKVLLAALMLTLLTVGPVYSKDEKASPTPTPKATPKTTPAPTPQTTPTPQPTSNPQPSPQIPTEEGAEKAPSSDWKSAPNKAPTEEPTAIPTAEPTVQPIVPTEIFTVEALDKRENKWTDLFKSDDKVIVETLDESSLILVLEAPTAVAGNGYSFVIKLALRSVGYSELLSAKGLKVETIVPNGDEITIIANIDQDIDFGDENCSKFTYCFVLGNLSQ